MTKTIQTPTIASADAGQSSRILKERLETRHRSYYAKDVAHTQTGERLDKRGRFLGLVVVILTTIVGTSAFASIGESPSTLAKIFVVILSLLAALAAAVKEYAAYEKIGAAHATAASAYRELRYKVDDLLTSLLRTGPSDQIQSDLVDVEAKALQIVEPALPKGSYSRAEVWIDQQIASHTRGGETDVL